MPFLVGIPNVLYEDASLFIPLMALITLLMIVLMILLLITLVIITLACCP